MRICSETGIALRGSDYCVSVNSASVSEFRYLLTIDSSGLGIYLFYPNGRLQLPDEADLRILTARTASGNVSSTLSLESGYKLTVDDPQVEAAIIETACNSSLRLIMRESSGSSASEYRFSSIRSVYSDGDDFSAPGALEALSSRGLAVPRFTLTAAPDGGDGEEFSAVYPVGEPVQLDSLPTYTREGYAFIGWSTRPGSASAEYLPSSAVTVWKAGTTRLYAVWEDLRSVTINFDAGRGTGSVSALRLVPGKEYVLPSGEGLSNGGLDFLGWALEEGGTPIAAGSVLTAAESLTLHAVWEKKEVAVTYVLDSSHSFVLRQQAGIPFGLPSVDGLLRNGRAVTGWCLSEGSERLDSAGQQIIYEDAVFYASTSHRRSGEKVVLRISNGAEPESLDPARVQGVPEHRLYSALFEGLIASDAEGNPVPGLAESWEVSEDGTQYTFKLRENALWSDGRPITAYDVVYSWLRELAPETRSPYAWFPCMFLQGASDYNAGTADASAVGIRALDDHTFQMDLIGPLPYVIGALEHYAFAVVPRHAIEQYGDAWILPENFVGNGPYVLTEWNPQYQIRVSRSETYWDKENVAIDEVIFLAADDEVRNTRQYYEGKIDWLTEAPSGQYASRVRDDYQIAPQISTYYYVLQTQKAPFNDVRVRKALSYAIDRQALADKVLSTQIPAWGVVPEMSGYETLEPEHEDVKRKMFDAELAQQLLAEAGYPGGAGFPSFTILYNSGSGHQAIAEFIRQQWKANLNIDVTLISQEWATYLANRNDGRFDVARAGWVGDYQDPNTFLELFVTGAGMNGGRYSNLTYDMLINEAAKMPSGADRYSVLRTAEEILINEDQAIIPLYFYTSANVIDTDKWGGWKPNVMDYHPVKEIYLK